MAGAVLDLPVELLAKARRLAEQQQVSVDSFLIQGLTQFVEKQERLHLDPAERLKSSGWQLPKGRDTGLKIHDPAVWREILRDEQEYRSFPHDNDGNVILPPKL